MLSKLKLPGNRKCVHKRVDVLLGREALGVSCGLRGNGMCFTHAVLREVLDERMAVLVPPEDTDRWVDAIQRCENRSYRSALAEAAYNAFREHYTWGKRAERVLSGVAW